MNQDLDVTVVSNLLGGPLDGRHVVNKQSLDETDYESAQVWSLFVATESGRIGYRSGALAPVVLQAILEGELPIGKSMVSIRLHYYEVTARHRVDQVVYLQSLYLGAQ